MNIAPHIKKISRYPCTLLERGIHCFQNILIMPRSENEDIRRHEFILNVILCCIIPLLIILDSFVAHAVYQEGKRYRGISFGYFSLLILVFGILLVLSRKGYYKSASYILITLYFAATTYGAIRWGVELPLVAISYVVIIVVSSILISTRFGFFATTMIAVSITAICLLQIHHVIQPLLFWKYTPVRINDAIELSAVFFLITGVSWLSNKEVEKSLRRARTSEKALLQERNNLEITIEERTKELKDSQQEKIIQLYRFAEFGKVSGGVFHDLMNSLQVVVSAVSRLEDTDTIPDVKDNLSKAVAASKRMGNYMETARKQLISDDTISTFSVEKEIQDAMDMLRFHAREAMVSITYEGPREIYLHGNALKFYQVIFNLLINGIDACKDTNQQNTIIIKVSTDITNNKLNISIKDTGCGISPDIIDIIFNPFFTTKHAHQGVGLGLSQTKEIIEKVFNGSIAVASTVGKGTIFTIIFPYHGS
jgi:signal transduction histidine kinase